jgi:hypothetical protein
MVKVSGVKNRQSALSRGLAHPSRRPQCRGYPQPADSANRLGRHRDQDAAPRSPGDGGRAKSSHPPRVPNPPYRVITSACRREPVFSKTPRTCVRTVWGETPFSEAISSTVCPIVRLRATRASAAVRSNGDCTSSTDGACGVFVGIRIRTPTLWEKRSRASTGGAAPPVRSHRRRAAERNASTYPSQCA